MKTIYRTTVVAKCPHGCADVYVAEFHVEDRTIMVECIQEAIRDATDEPIYQEALTQCLANQLGCRVFTRGVHLGFDTECRADPKVAE